MRKTRKDLSRREFLALSGAAALALGFPAVVRAAGRVRKVVVLAIDGMDPGLLRRFLRAGRMPNCARLIESGCFHDFGTSDPPQSPVAWSNFITGTNPGGHGIFDFIARDPATLLPYLATARTSAPKHELKLGSFNLPLSGAQTALLRKGPTLWKILEDAGIHSKVIRAPVNFPPVASTAETLSGLTTPDIHGSYGVFSFYTDSPDIEPRDVSGGRIERVALRNGRAECLLRGPADAFRADHAKIRVPFSVTRDPERPLARVAIQDSEFVLREGEWSNWVTVSFAMLPYVAETTGICRFYLKKVHPHLEVFVSPVNIDPANPAMPISTPDDYAAKLAREVGLFNTQGMAEDTSARSAGVLDDDEYRAQATFVLDETNRLYEHTFARFDEGFYYCYFSSLDLNSHMFWRCHDPKHPLYSRELERRQGDFLPGLYAAMDRAVGRALEKMDDRTLLFVISDHGFTSFRRQFNLNSWLWKNGYAGVLDADNRDASFFENTDWASTRAYGLGINGLYLNLRGREPDGTVDPADAEKLRAELAEKLTAVRDPATGEPPVARVMRPEEVYSGPYVAAAPDLVVGYNRYYRASWATILGGYPAEILLDNRDPWSGDHCMDSQFLPGVFLCNRPIAADKPALLDMAPTILTTFGVSVPGEMTGRSIL